MIRAWIEPVRAFLLRLLQGVTMREHNELKHFYYEDALHRAELTAQLRAECEQLKERILLADGMKDAAWKENERLRAELAEAQEHVFDCFHQYALLPTGKYDHSCISTYEQAQDYLIKIGRIKPEDCVRE